VGTGGRGDKLEHQQKKKRNLIDPGEGKQEEENHLQKGVAYAVEMSD